MPILLIEHGTARRAGIIRGRVLIGRWPVNTIAVDDPSLSRVHAWIGPSADGYYVADAGSRTGTFVNQERVGLRHALSDGEVIRVGPLAITFREADALPADAQPIDLSSKPSSKQEVRGGFLLECACGAPMWVPVDYLGKRAQCRFCGRLTVVTTPKPMAEKPPADLQPQAKVAASAITKAVTVPTSITVPREAEPAALAKAHAGKPELTCGICQTEIAGDESTTACPACGLVFHADCWTENRGCAAYGCSQVDALDWNELSTRAEKQSP